MRLKCFSKSLVGPKGENQDAVLELLETTRGFWCAIADGVGGKVAGALASEAAISGVANLAPLEPSMEELFRGCAKIFAEQEQRSPNAAGMATTLTVVFVQDGFGSVGHVGDSRLIHIRGGGVIARTADQTEVQKLIDDGVISRRLAKRYPRRNVLLSVLSRKADYNLFETRFGLQDRDRLLLSTDGFHGCLLKREVASISEEKPEFQEFCQFLCKELETRTRCDDATFLALEYHE